MHVNRTALPWKHLLGHSEDKDKDGLMKKASRLLY